MYISAKNQKQLTEWKNVKKIHRDRFFRDISGNSDRQKCLTKIWLRHILGITILHKRVKNQKKNVENNSKYPEKSFSGGF